MGLSGLWIAAAYGKTRSGGTAADGGGAAVEAQVLHSQQQPRQPEGEQHDAVHGPVEAAQHVEAPPPVCARGWERFRWIPHLPVRIPGVEVCLRCGHTPARTAQAATWRAEPCSGELAVEELPGRVGVALNLLSEDWLRQLTEPTRSRARAIRDAQFAEARARGGVRVAGASAGSASAGSGSASWVRGARWGRAGAGVPARGGGGDARGVIAVAGGAADTATGIEPVRGGAADTQRGVLPATDGGRRPEGCSGAAGTASGAPPGSLTARVLRMQAQGL